MLRPRLDAITVRVRWKVVISTKFLRFLSTRFSQCNEVSYIHRVGSWHKYFSHIQPWIVGLYFLTMLLQFWIKSKKFSSAVGWEVWRSESWSAKLWSQRFSVSNRTSVYTESRGSVWRWRYDYHITLDSQHLTQYFVFTKAVHIQLYVFYDW